MTDLPSWYHLNTMRRALRESPSGRLPHAAASAAAALSLDDWAVVFEPPVGVWTRDALPMCSRASCPSISACQELLRSACTPSLATFLLCQALPNVCDALTVGKSAVLQDTMPAMQDEGGLRNMVGICVQSCGVCELQGERIALFIRTMKGRSSSKAWGIVMDEIKLRILAKLGIEVLQWIR